MLDRPYTPYTQYVGLLQYVAREFEKLAETEGNEDRLRFFASIIDAMCNDLLHGDEPRPLFSGPFRGVDRG